MSSFPRWLIEPRVARMQAETDRQVLEPLRRMQAEINRKVLEPLRRMQAETNRKVLEPLRRMQAEINRKVLEPLRRIQAETNRRTALLQAMINRQVAGMEGSRRFTQMTVSQNDLAELSARTWPKVSVRNLVGKPIGPRISGFPRVWELLGYLFPRWIQRRAYEPTREELLEDYVRARKERTKWVRGWLAFCFTCRTVLVMAQCFLLLLKEPLVKLIVAMLPEPLRQWWMRINGDN